MIEYLKRLTENDVAEVYIFGCGDYGQKASTALAMGGVIISGYFDNALPEGGVKNGFMVSPLSRLQQLDSAKAWFVIAVHRSKEIEKQLGAAGIEHLLGLRDLPLNYHADYPVLSFPQYSHPRVSLLVTAFNDWRLTYDCLYSILVNGNDIPFEILLGDNNSTDETAQAEKYVSGIKVVHHHSPSQYLLNVNRLAKRAEGEYIVLVQNDSKFITKKLIDKLVRLMDERKDYGAVCGKIWQPLENSWYNPYVYDLDGNQIKISLEKTQLAEYLMPIAVIIRRSLWESIGGYDETFLPVYYEDNDLFLKIVKAGYKCVYWPEVTVVHYHDYAYGKDTKLQIEATEKNKEIFLQRYQEYFKSERLAYQLQKER